VSDFIGPKGRITLEDPLSGNTIKDARKIIYLGSNRDPWWNTEQLLVQLKDTLNIFKEKHPGAIAVLVFDQSSAHASYGKGALNAFNINLGPGGAQKILKDTIFPPETSNPERIGTEQVMWQLNKDRAKEAKGIKQVLIKRGCFIPGLRVKCKDKDNICTDIPLYLAPPTDNTPCCLARILQGHKDFYFQKSALA
jgi:hypothetical protein